MPDFYGRNLDALWDVITGYIDMDSVIVFHGTASFTDDFASVQMRKVSKTLREAEKKYGKPNIANES